MRMALSFRKLHPRFVAEVGPVDFPFDVTKHRRELRRVATLDIPEPALVTPSS
jgi:hypothetical protein